MRSRLLGAALLLKLALLCSAQCGAKCKFRFCGAGLTPKPAGVRVLLRAPNTALSAGICRVGKRKLLKITRVGEAAVSASADGTGAFFAVSDYMPDGLDTAFKKDFFKVFKLPFGQMQGVGRKRSFGRQEEFLDDLCVVLPVAEYEVRVRKGGRKTVAGRRNDCISFRTINPGVLVEVSWNTRDNLDLEVVEPDGDVVSRDTPRSENGRLNNDNNQQCELATNGKEAVFYGRGGVTERGTYRAVVRHSGKCGGARTLWRLRVVVNGVLVKVVRGVAEGGGGGEVVGEESFEVL